MRKIILILVAVCVVGLFAMSYFKKQQSVDPLSAVKTVPSQAASVQVASSASLPIVADSGQQATSSFQLATSAAIVTSKGTIELSLFPKDAPNTVANFIKKAKSGFYNNLTFHRVEDWVIQGGDPLGNGTGGGNMPVEFNNKPYVVGSLGVASRGDGKVQNDAQFFITKKDSASLNGQYTNFGIVTKGVDVVNNIQIGDKILGITVE